MLLIVVLVGSAGVIGVICLKNNAVEVETPNIEDKDDDESNTESKRRNKTSDDEDADDDIDEDEDYGYDDDIIDEDDEADIDYDEDEYYDEDEDEDYDDDSEFFPSDREYITYSDLEGKSEEEVAMIRNEIFARRGYIFSTEPYKSYFESQDWYVPNANFNESMFNSVEKANKDFIVAYEESRGWR